MQYSSSLRELLAARDGSRPLEQAVSPPAAWYCDDELFQLEQQAVLLPSWQAVGRSDQVTAAGDYFAGRFLNQPLAVVRDEADRLAAFRNVCAHHAAEVAVGEGNCRELVCPYHGWTYSLAGDLKRAPRLGAVRDFEPGENGLGRLPVTPWGPLVMVHWNDAELPLPRTLAPLDERLRAAGWDRLRFHTRREYVIACNWKVFVDNYLDGGYHVSHLHGGLAGQLDLNAYTTEVFDRFSIQSCTTPTDRKEGSDNAAGTGAEGDFVERLGSGALYAWVYPNLMINRYGPMMDVNWVVPLESGRTLTVFDYYFEEGLDEEFIQRSLAASHQVQVEDVAICESVQRGLASGSFPGGRYAVPLEQAMHRFHAALSSDLREAVG